VQSPYLFPFRAGFGTTTSSKFVILILLKVPFLPVKSIASVLSGKIGSSIPNDLYLEIFFLTEAIAILSVIIVKVKDIGQDEC
jgi:hypothetical protein